MPTLDSLHTKNTDYKQNFSAYSFGIFASSWLVFILPAKHPLWQDFGMATAINSFWLPGALLGAFLADWIGPKWTITGGVALQGIVGFAMTGAYSELNQPSRVAGFIILTGIFMALGEVGPGDNIGLFASKLSATPIRGTSSFSSTLFKRCHLRPHRPILRRSSSMGQSRRLRRNLRFPTPDRRRRR
jgi:hypothetical protein